MKVKHCIESIGLTYCTQWKRFINDLGVQVTEDLKFVTDEEWDTHIKSLSVSKTQCRKLDAAILNLKSTGPADPSINKPLPLQSESMPKDAEIKPSYEKTKNR